MLNSLKLKQGTIAAIPLIGILGGFAVGLSALAQDTSTPQIPRAVPTPQPTPGLPDNSDTVISPPGSGTSQQPEPPRRTEPLPGSGPTGPVSDQGAGTPPPVQPRVEVRTAVPGAW